MKDTRSRPLPQIVLSPPVPTVTAAIALPDDARILVVKLATLGDLLLATPALRALRQRYPRARLDVLTTRQAAPLLRDSPLVDHVYTLVAGSSAWAPLATLATLATLARLRATRYDAIALLHHLTLPAGRVKHRALLAAIGARWRAGLDNGHGGFLTVRVDDQGFGARHEAAYYLAVAATLGASAPNADAPTTRLPPRLPSPRGGGAGGEGAPLIAVHPGAGAYSVARRWPVAKFAEVMRELHAETGARFVVVGGSDEAPLRLRLLRALGFPAWAAPMEDVGYAVEVADGSAPHGFGANDDPQALASILRRCDLFIGDDSFPMHMAATVGTPVVAIFGPSNHLAWGPYVAASAHSDTGDTGQRAVVVRRADLVCSPCLYRGHALGMREGCAPRPCLNELAAEAVIAAAQGLLARPSMRNPPPASL